jgi:hypothetical protein
MSTKPNKPTEVLTAKDLTSQVDDLIAIAVERGREAAAQLTKPARRTQRVLTTNVRVTEGADEFLRDELRQVLESEVMPVVEASGGQGMFDDEVRREIVKKALVTLKAETLRRLAQEMGLDKRGKVEQVAERIARAYKYDYDSVASLIVDNSDEPEPERRFLDRLFPVAAMPPLEQLSDELHWAAERYVRVGIARWFAVDSIELAGTALRVTGHIRSLKAFVSEQEEEPTLTSAPTDAPVAVDFQEGCGFVRVEGIDVSSARSALRAIKAISALELEERLPLPFASHLGVLGTLDPHTIPMLDVIHNRLSRAEVRRPNLTIAKFRMRAVSEEELDEDDAERPSLKSVRFEGRHLLDSVSACQLIALDARALVDLSLVVGVDLAQDEEARFPIRVAFEQDHAAVMTGYGLHPKVSEVLHSKLIDVVEHAITDGVLDEHRLGTLAERIHAFALAEEPADRATMLDDE